MHLKQLILEVTRLNQCWTKSNMGFNNVRLYDVAISAETKQTLLLSDEALS